VHDGRFVQVLVGVAATKAPTGGLCRLVGTPDPTRFGAILTTNCARRAAEAEQQSRRLGRRGVPRRVRARPRKWPSTT
jgi:hypothetical protein